MILSNIINKGYSILALNIGGINLLDKEDIKFYNTLVYIKDNINQIMSSMTECEPPIVISDDAEFKGVNGVYVVSDEYKYYFYVYMNDKWYRTNINLL